MCVGCQGGLFKTSVSLSRSLEKLLMIVAHARERALNFMAPCPLGKAVAQQSPQSGLEE